MRPQAQGSDYRGDNGIGALNKLLGLAPGNGRNLSRLAQSDAPLMVVSGQDRCREQQPGGDAAPHLQALAVVRQSTRRCLPKI